MAVLVTAIHVFLVSRREGVDAWDKPGHDDIIQSGLAYNFLPQHRLAALDHGDAPCLHLGFERNHAAVLPQLYGHGLAGIDRRGEPRRVLPEGGRIVIGVGLQYAAAGDAVGAHAMQDRFWKTGFPGKSGIAVQRIAVTAEPIDQRLVRTRWDVDDLVGRAG